MAGCFDLFRLGLLASCTGICLHSCFCTGRCLRDLSCIPVMAKCRYFCLGFDYFATNRTMASLCFSSFLTGCGYGCIFYFFMAGCFDLFRLGLLASCTGICLYSCFCTGRCFRDLSRIPVMAKCRYFFLSFDYFATNRAMTSFCFSSFLTGCGYGCIFYFFMAGCFDLFRLGLLASCTGICLYSCFCTGRCFRDLSRIPVMTECRYFCLLFEHFVTYRTMASFCFSVCLTGRCYRCIFYFFVTGCFDFFLIKISA